MSDPITTTTPPIPDDAPRVYVRPSLNRDLAGLLTLLFIITTAYIQYPTLLFRAQYGRAFRDIGLQKGVAVALIISAVWLMSGAWAGRNSTAGRLKLAFTLGMGAFALHAFAMIWLDFNIFSQVYAVSAAVYEDVFREADLANSAKAFNSAAMLGGMALAALVFLWSPWETQQNKATLAAGLVALVALVAAYHLQHPLLASRSTLGRSLEGMGEPVGVALLLSTAALVLLAQRGTAQTIMSIILSLFTLHVLAVVFAERNIFLDTYAADPAVYNTLLADGGLNTAILALDRGGMLAGVALISAFLLWSPWQRLRLYAESIQRNTVPLVVALVALVLWESLINIFDIQQFLLPRPSVIGNELAENYPKLIAAGWFTFLNALKGFALGCGLGILTGMVSARFTKFSTAVLPLAVAANSVPIIAFAPIMNFWFGVTSPNSKIAIVAVLCYFPAMISTVRGLTSVNQIQLELMRSYAATEVDIFRKLRIPNALPFIFSALKLATTLSMIGAIVSEFFGGSLSGLGYRIREDAALFRFPASWSAIIVASLFGISFYLFITALERQAMPWYQSFRSES